MAVRPLLVRPGARYVCFGDGLCCTDAHAVGPLTRAEVKRLNVLRPGLVRPNPQIGGMVVVADKGACVHLGSDGCRIHREHGAEAKPGVCRRFPYRLVATPRGGRVATEHRCPCRTMGERPAIDLRDAEASLVDGAGRLSADVRVPASVAVDAHEVSFDAWIDIERRVLERLLSLEDPLDVLDAAPFPALDGASWTDVAHHYRSRIDGSTCGDALAWFGDVLLALQGEGARPLRARPWSSSFDRAEARATVQRDPREVLADWIADEIWGCEWTERGSFLVARHDLASRYVVARDVARRLEGAGVRRDRAAAEAVLVAELAGATGLWRSVVAAFRVGGA